MSEPAGNERAGPNGPGLRLSDVVMGFRQGDRRLDVLQGVNLAIAPPCLTTAGPRYAAGPSASFISFIISCRNFRRWRTC